jgi:transposase
MAAAEEHLPEAKMILDHFHLVKYMNDKLSMLRCQLFAKAGDEGKRLLKGTRWLLLKSRAHLGRSALFDLDEALRCNEPLYIAYYLKEELASLWSLGSKAEAEEHLENWLLKAANSGVGMLKKVSKWLGRVKDKILNWFDCPISSGKLEAFNGQIRRLLKNTCGLRDQEYLFLRIQDLVDAKL